MSSVPVLNFGGDSSEEDEADEIPQSNLENQEKLSNGKHSIVLFQNDDEEEEMDEPVVFQENSTSITAQEASTEFSEAYQAILSNANDISSWMTYLSEVRNYNYGPISLEEAYKPVFQTFPRAYSVYCDYVSQCLERQMFSEADEIFSRVLSKSRNIDLWIIYTTYLRTVRHPLDKPGKSLDEYNNDRRAIEVAYDQAIANVGQSFNSYRIWKEYLDFVKSWPETGLYSDVGRKLLTLRKIYQKVVNIPVENLDQLWKEYEQLEKQAGEHLAEKVLPEYQEKYLHAKAIYQDRKRLTQGIDFFRFATSPARELNELQQLDLWNKWIKFEQGNPDNLSQANLTLQLQLIFEQCLHCFTRHAELWMAYASFVLENNGITEARAAYREAIECIPKSALLRVSYAELEEKAGNHDTVRDILKAALMNIPSGFTFAVYQRYIRRREGVLAARKLFSETLTMRHDKSIGFEISLAHAQLELDSNADASTALKVLELAHSYHPPGCPVMRYIHLRVRCLLRLGDLKQLQWSMTSSIEELTSIIAAHYQLTSAGENISLTGMSITGVPLIDYAKNKVPADFDLLKALRDLMYLYEEYLHVEVVMGLSDISHITSLRQKRDKCKADYEELALIQAKKAITADELQDKYRGTGIFQFSYDLSERYDLLCNSLPPIDEQLRERSVGRKLIDLLTRQDIERQLARKRDASGSRKGSNTGSGPAGVDLASAELSNVPYILRELLVHLPSHSGPLPDIDGCIRQLKNIVLPPRPIPDDIVDSSTAAQGSKRARDGTVADILPGSDWMGASSGVEPNEVEEELLMKPGDVDYVRSDDVFRQRQRARLLL